MAFEADEMFINYQELQNSKQKMAVSLDINVDIKQCIFLSSPLSLSLSLSLSLPPCRLSLMNSGIA